MAGLPRRSDLGKLLGSFAEQCNLLKYDEKMPHSTRFRGKKCHRSAKPSGGQDLEVEQPVVCWDCSSFDFYSTLSGMDGATLIRHQVVQMRQPRQKRLLAPFGMMEAFHCE